MKLAVALAVIAVFSACKRSAPDTADSVPIKEVVAGVPMIDFEATETKFSARVPADWGVRQEKYLDPKKGVVLSGGKGTSIFIFKYPEMDPQTDARKYAETAFMLSSKGQPEITEERAGERTVLRYHYERMPYPKRTRDADRPNRIDVVLIPVKGGFYELQHIASVDSYQKTLPVFEAVVRSFKPKP